MNKFFNHEVFPYKSLGEEHLEKYKLCFEQDKVIAAPVYKLIFDKTVSALVLLTFFPIMVLIFLGYMLEGFFSPGAGYWPLYYYDAVSEGRKFKKYKFRAFRSDAVDYSEYGRNDWRTYFVEWSKNDRTVVGSFVKKYYLDELPQFYSVLTGQMSLIGPRPLATIHYEKELQNGNLFRKFVRGGLLGLGHVRKGTAEMGDPRWDFEYMYQLLTASKVKLFLLDLSIIKRGVRLMLKGEGL
ncbi:sugar transferase [bacterium]|nr:sugar transferase [bacterium]